MSDLFALAGRLRVQSHDPVRGRLVNPLPFEPNFETAQVKTLQLDRRRRGPDFLLVEIARYLFELFLEGQQITIDVRGLCQWLASWQAAQFTNQRDQPALTRLGRAGQVFGSAGGRAMPATPTCQLDLAGKCRHLAPVARGETPLGFADAAQQAFMDSGCCSQPLLL